MKRCGFILLGLSLLGFSGDSSFDGGGAYAGEAPQLQQQQQGALGENAAALPRPTPGETPKVYRTVHAHVVAIDQPYVINRLGASQPEGMIFVLKDDLVPKVEGKCLDYDNFKLRPGKRPRPLVLRMNVGDLLEIHFENWLQSIQNLNPQQPTSWAQLAPFNQNTRYAGIHVNGLDFVPKKVGGGEGILSDGSWVGRNESSLLQPKSTATKPEDPKSRIYRLYARHTGTFLLTSAADTTVHQLNAGLFGAVNVQPQRAEWYRSQTTSSELQAATLNTDDLRLHEQTLGGSVPTPMLTPDQEMLQSDQGVTAAKQAQEREQGVTAAKQFQGRNQEGAAAKQAPKLRPRSLRTATRGPRTAVVANVFVNEEGRIYSKLKQPLINYFSVFNEGDLAKCPTAISRKPILSMLKAEIPNPPPPKLTQPLGPDRTDGYVSEIHDLDSGFITFSLRELFKKGPINIDLAPDASVARIASDKKYSWVVTNPGTMSGDGRTYLVQGDDVERTVTIQECQLHLVYSDLTAVITGPNAGNFSFSQDAPDFYTNPASPDRRQPYREFTIIYHQGGNVVQAFQPWSNNNLFNMINAGMDAFGINYGIAAIGPEIVANRLGVGPMGNDQQPTGKSGPPNPTPMANQKNDAVDLKYEEFFLSSWAVGDPAMVVDVPSNTPNQMVSNPEEGSGIRVEPQSIPITQLRPNPVQFVNFKPLSGARPTKVFYPDDPSNVYHSYMRDHAKFRILHAGPGARRTSITSTPTSG